MEPKPNLMSNIPAGKPTRDRYVHRLLEPWLSLHYSSSPTEEEVRDFRWEEVVANHVALPSRDESLTAFAQLATLRLNCKRGFISLIDSNCQYVLAEATQSLLPGGDGFTTVDDSISLGRVTIGRDHGICAQACDFMIHQDSENAVFLTQDLIDHPSLKLAPIFKRIRKARFYATVPIYGDGSRVVGNVAVFGDEPRQSLSKDDIALLRGISATASRHLAHCQGLAVRNRCERMLKGLSLFMEGGSSLREWWIATQRVRMSRQDSWVRDTRTQEQQLNDEAIEEFGPEHRPGKVSNPNKSRSSPDRAHSEGDNPSTRAASSSGKSEPSASDARLQAEQRYDEAQDASIASRDVQKLFSKASNFIREASALDGVIFFDVADGQANTPLTKDSPYVDGAIPHLGSSIAQDPAVCSILGFSVSAKSSLFENVPSLHQKKLKQTDLNMLISLYPRGKILNYSADNGTLVTSDSNSESKDSNVNDRFRFPYLREIAPNARSLAIFPLWDFLKSRWLAVCLAWTSNPFRYLTVSEDLMYLRAFGATVMIDVSRLDAASAERSKSLLLSAVSHEMRSPLHGILASIEFLKDTKLDSMSENLVNTIETSGQTLLDTINNVLEYASISAESSSANNVTISTGKLGNRSSSVTETEKISDVAAVLEEVTGSVLLGSMHSNLLSPTVAAQPSKPVTVILDLDWPQIWQLSGVNPVSFKRIFMNLLRNSCKFTQAGHIIVSISQGGYTSSSPLETDPLILEVRDTGCGISPEYLKHHLYQPFAKDDAKSEGTGLGLHLTQRLVYSIGGTINISSSENIGTNVRVTIPNTMVGKIPRELSQTGYQNIIVGLFGFNSFETADNRVYHLSIGNILRYAVGVQVSEVEELNSTLVDVLIVEGDYFRTNFEAALGVDAERPLVTPLVVLCHDLFYVREAFKRNPHIHFLIPPFGAGVLSHIIAKCCPSIIEDASSMQSRSQVIPNLSSPREQPSTRLETSQRAQRLGNGLAEQEKVPYSSIAWQKEEPLKDPDSSIAKDDNSDITKQSAPLPKSVRFRQPEQECDLKGLRVLLVEDNNINLQLLVAFAQKHRLSYSTASNGQEAYEIFQTNAADDSDTSFQAIITDIDMPVMDGLELCRRIRQLEKEFGPRRATLLITLTGVSSSEVKDSAYRSGVSVFLSKPAKFKEILAILKDKVVKRG